MCIIETRGCVLIERRAMSQSISSVLVSQRPNRLRVSLLLVYSLFSSSFNPRVSPWFDSQPGRWSKKINWHWYTCMSLDVSWEVQLYQEPHDLKGCVVMTKKMQTFFSCFLFDLDTFMKLRYMLNIKYHNLYVYTMYIRNFHINT